MFFNLQSNRVFKKPVTFQYIKEIKVLLCLIASLLIRVSMYCRKSQFGRLHHNYTKHIADIILLLLCVTVIHQPR